MPTYEILPEDRVIDRVEAKLNGRDVDIVAYKSGMDLRDVSWQIRSKKDDGDKYIRGKSGRGYLIDENGIEKAAEKAIVDATKALTNGAVSNGHKAPKKDTVEPPKVHKARRSVDINGRIDKAIEDLCPNGLKSGSTSDIIAFASAAKEFVKKVAL